MASNGLDKFPVSFNFKTAQARVTFERTKEEAGKARSYIMNKYEKAVADNKSYFSITLVDTEYSAETRVIVISELLQAFPNIGYNPQILTPVQTPQERAYRELIEKVHDASNRVELTPEEKAFAALLENMCETRLANGCSMHGTPAKNQKRTVTRLRDPTQATNSIHFFIALTDETARNLETYNW